MAQPVKQLGKEYPVILSQDIAWGDMDAFGHVNNTVYFRYFENARIEYFNRIGVRLQKKQLSMGPILASARCNFRIPLDFPDHIHIGIRSRLLSAKKFSMEFAVLSERHGAIAAEGDGLIVYYDYAAGKSCEIPDAIVAAIKMLEFHPLSGGAE